MRATGRNETQLVLAAQAGDAAALDELATASLPLVYAIVRRALGEHPDVDDVVQDTMVRALRDLHALRSPESFRSWLMAIAVNQVGTHLHRRHVAAERTTVLDAVVAVPDPGAAVEGVTVLRQDMAGQRRQIGRAARWLEPGDRTVLSLWWLETAGEISRSELAAAIGTSVAHAGVRVQRMRQQLETSRAAIAALETVPRCAGLGLVVQEWDGVPSPVWRKRIARHVRSCPICGRATDGLVPVERLFVGFGLLTVPLTLVAAVSGKLAAGVTGGVAGVKVGVMSQLAAAMVAHPVAALMAAGTLTVGGVVVTTAWPDPGSRTAVVGEPSPLSGRRPILSPSPTPSPARTSGLQPGPVSLEFANEPGRYVTMAGTFGVLVAAGPGSDPATRRRATFRAVPGLADPDCVTFQAQDGTYLRHSSWRLRQDRDQGTVLFRGDATFCVREGPTAGTVSLESANYPGFFLRRVRQELWVDQSDGSASFEADSVFVIRPPLA